MTDSVTSDHPVVLFDGVCNMCNASVDFVIRHDHTRRYRFASLQSDTAVALVPSHDPNGELTSLMLLEAGVLHTKSTAALKIARGLSAPWPLMYGFIIVPRIIRDLVYDWIARNRYKWFGKRDTCRLPTDEERALFL